MTINIDITQRLGAFSLDVRFESHGRLVALFGPSGSGKTSLVNLLSGLARPDSGHIKIDGRILADVEKGIFVAAHKRRIGYVFQDARLFPHLSVAQNLRYGRFFTPSSERYADFDAVVDLLGIGHLLQRQPGLLSGGEKQRVAIGRALIASPRLILMDEPLAALDDARKTEIMPYIERLRDETKIPIVYVSHSVPEVARLATDIVALSAGKVIAHGSASSVLTRLDPAAGEYDEASALIELEMVATDDGHGLSLLRSSGGEWHLPKIDAPAGTRLRARIRARDVMLATERPHGISALNIIAAQITAIADSDGPQALIRLDHGSEELVARITRRSLETLSLVPGQKVFAIVKAVSFDPGGTAAIPVTR